jgi:hypothetical protein
VGVANHISLQIFSLQPIAATLSSLLIAPFLLIRLWNKKGNVHPAT